MRAERKDAVSRDIALGDLSELAIRGGATRIGSVAIGFVVRIGSVMVIGRLLDPKDFGLVGMATAVVGILNLFKDFGLSTATVQRKTIDDEQASTLFWINILVGIALALITFGSAPLLARFYHEPRLFGVTAVLALGFLANAAGVQHSARLMRQMRFATTGVIDIISLLMGTAVAIGLAAVGYGYWALVASTICIPAVSTICAWLATRWIPGPPRRQVGVASMVRFGGTLTLNGIVVYLAFNLEKILLGRYWGLHAVGIYGRAYQLNNIPTEALTSAVGGVAFSALSRLQDDPNRLKSYFLKGYSLLLAMTFPVTIACGLFANDVIPLILGPQWIEAIPIFRFLSPTIAVFAMIHPMAWLLFALGKVNRSLKIALVLAPLVVGSYLIGLPYGPKGVALAYSTALVLWVTPHLAWCVHGTAISFREILLTVARPLLSGLVAFCVAFAAQALYGNLLPALPRLIIGVLILSSAYLAMLLHVMGQKEFYVTLVRRLIKPSVAQEITLDTA